MVEDLRAATAVELALLEYLLRAPGVPADALLPQLDGLQVRRDCACGCPTVALRPAEHVPPSGDSSLEITAGCPGGIIVLFVRAGRLSGLELTCLDAVLTDWPALGVLTPPSAA